VALKVGSRELIGEAGVFAAVEKGYFREEGLDVSLESSRTTPEQTAPLVTGELAYASFGVDPSIFNAVTRGIPIKIVGYNAIINPRNDSGGWMVRQELVDSGRYREPRDLKGLNVFITTPGGTSQVLAERMLAKGGLTLDDVELNTLPFQDFPAGFANKIVDSGFLPEPFVSVTLRQRTAQLVMPTGQIYFPGTPVMVLGMSPVFAQQQPEAARRFLVGYLRGQRDYYRTFVKQEGGRAEWDAILMKHTPIKDPEMFTRMTTHDVEPDGAMDVTALDQLQDYFLKYGAQQQRVDLSQMIDPSYTDYALGRLGRMAP
jgi:NitT/TauT family transport system substrate-binding protein